MTNDDAEGPSGPPEMTPRTPHHPGSILPEMRKRSPIRRKQSWEFRPRGAWEMSRSRKHFLPEEAGQGRRVTHNGFDPRVDSTQNTKLYKIEKETTKMDILGATGKMRTECVLILSCRR